MKLTNDTLDTVKRVLDKVALFGKNHNDLSIGVRAALVELGRNARGTLDRIAADEKHHVEDEVTRESVERVVFALSAWAPSDLVEAAYGLTFGQGYHDDGYLNEKAALISRRGGAYWYHAELDLGSRRRLLDAIDKDVA